MSEAADIRTACHVRPFYWSLRRELWENRAVYLAPLAGAGVVLLAVLFSAGRLPSHLAQAAELTPKGARAAMALGMPFAAAAGAAFVIGFVVAVFYCLGAFHGERRDRSLLFWKSLPVSDRTTVLAKATVPLVIQPLVVLAVAVATQLVILAISVLVLTVGGGSVGAFWPHTHLPMIWAMLPYGLVVNLLWDAPIYGWCLLVSASVKRMTFLWAVAPWLLLSLFEVLTFRTGRVWGLIHSRLFDGYNQAFTVNGAGVKPISSLSQVDPLRILQLPGLWGGLVFAALCLVACVWLRRRHDPI